MTPAPSIVGPNTYDALARAGVFRLVNRWGKKIAIESWAVKDFYCTPDATGMNLAIADTVRAVNAVKTAGGGVAYLAMDEPFVSGRARTCNGPALEPTADRVATYVNGVKGAFPDIQIGLIEAYPFSSADAIERIVGLLKARGVPAGIPPSRRRLAPVGSGGIHTRHAAAAGVRRLGESHVRDHHQRRRRQFGSALRDRRLYVDRPDRRHLPVVGSHARPVDRPELGGLVHGPRHHADQSARGPCRTPTPTCCGTCCAACAEPTAPPRQERPSAAASWRRSRRVAARRRRRSAAATVRVRRIR